MLFPELEQWTCARGASSTSEEMTSVGQGESVTWTALIMSSNNMFIQCILAFFNCKWINVVRTGDFTVWECHCAMSQDVDRSLQSNVNVQRQQELSMWQPFSQRNEKYGLWSLPDWVTASYWPIFSGVTLGAPRNLSASSAMKWGW